MKRREPWSITADIDMRGGWFSKTEESEMYQDLMIVHSIDNAALKTNAILKSGQPVPKLL